MNSSGAMFFFFHCFNTGKKKELIYFCCIIWSRDQEAGDYGGGWLWKNPWVCWEAISWCNTVTQSSKCVTEQTHNQIQLFAVSLFLHVLWGSAASSETVPWRKTSRSHCFHGDLHVQKYYYLLRVWTICVCFRMLLCSRRMQLATSSSTCLPCELSQTMAHYELQGFCLSLHHMIQETFLPCYLCIHDTGDRYTLKKFLEDLMLVDCSHT